jgi:matrixin/uncharacterized protein DUF4214/putative peptidoglycan binding protein
MGNEVTDQASAIKYLTRFGYIAHDAIRGIGALPNSAERQSADGILNAAIAEFQRMAKLRPTGRLDPATYRAMSVPRCGIPDSHRTGASSRIAIGANFVAHGTLWNRGIVTYSFNNRTSDITQARQTAVIEDAFQRWAAAVPLEFQQASAGTTADIVISFETGDHGDGSPFDGAGGVLAHSFYPSPNGGEIAGDVHFDDDETWQEGFTTGGFDMLSVAVHEIGHALGLEHTSVPNSTMNPFYPTPSTPADDDRAGIRQVYREQIWIASLYRDLLGRRFDPDGFDGWVRQRFSNVSPEAIAHGFVFSKEHCRNVASELYFLLLDRAPDQGGLDAWTSALQSGTSRQEIILGFICSAEYLATNPAPDQFVYSLYRRLLVREPDPGGLAAWTTMLANGAPVSDVARGFLYSEEFSRIYARSLYISFLRREPDPAGWQSWTDALVGGTSQQEVLVGFLASQEYRNNTQSWW